MDKRIPPSARLEQAIADLVEDAQWDPARLAELGRLGAQLILQRAVEEEVSSFLGRAHYERAPPARGYRNGTRPRRVHTAEGELVVQVPQVRGTLERFVCRTIPGTRTVVRTRPLEALITGATGGCILSRSVVSEVTERLWQEYRAFRERDLSDLEVEYLFADGLYESLRRMGRRKEAVLCLWAICADGRKVLLDVVVGNRESMEAWLDCRRGWWPT